MCANNNRVILTRIRTLSRMNLEMWFGWVKKNVIKTKGWYLNFYYVVVYKILFFMY